MAIYALDTVEEVAEKVEAIQLELMEKEEMTLTEEQIEALVPEELEGDELEELKGNLSKPLMVYAFRNLDGDIDEGIIFKKNFQMKSKNLNDLSINCNK